jgi:hypothetical protein
MRKTFRPINKLAGIFIYIHNEILVYCISKVEEYLKRISFVMLRLKTQGNGMDYLLELILQGYYFKFKLSSLAMKQKSLLNMLTSKQRLQK